MKLDGLSFSLYANWPGAIHEGNGEALMLIDERADARAAIRPSRRCLAESLADHGKCWAGPGRRCMVRIRLPTR